MSSVREQANGRWSARAYDPTTQGHKHLGTFDTEAEARAAYEQAMSLKPRKCIECGERFRPHDARQLRCKASCRVNRKFTRDKPREHANHWLYRVFDEADALLYVGVTNANKKRMGQHATEKGWADEVATIRIEHFPDRASALEAEKAAIKSERPLYNVRHGKPLKKVVRLDDYRKEAS